MSISSLRKELKSLEDERDEIESKLDKLEAQKDNISKNKEIELKSILDKERQEKEKPFKDELLSTQKQVEELKNQKNEIDLSENDFYKKYLEVENLKELLAKRNLKVDDLNPKSPKYYLKNIKDYRRRVKEYKEVEKYNLKSLRGFLSFIINPPLSGLVYTIYLICIIGVIIKRNDITFVGGFFALNLLLITLILINYRLFKYYKDLKEFEVRIPDILKMLKKSLDNLEESEKQKIDKIREDKMNDLMQRLSELRKNINNIKIDKPKDIDIKYKNFENKLEEDIESLENKLDEIEKEIDRIRRELKDEISKFTERVLPYKVNEKNFILPDKIIVDVSPYKEIPLDRDLMLFTYSDEDSLRKFIKLMISQLLMSVNPFSLSFKVYDLINGGSSVRELLFENYVIELITKEDQQKKDLQGFLDSYYLGMSDLRNKDNLDDYNEFMLSIDSLTREYKILLFMEPEESLMKDKNFKQLCNIASLSGIIPIVFSKDIKVINYAKKCYVITKDDIIIKNL